jgi:hypothetical protein
MRYKVRAPDDAAYEELLRTLTEDEAVEVLLTSPRRRGIATGDLPEGSRRDIAAIGGEISEDVQYDLEHLG